MKTEKSQDDENDISDTKLSKLVRIIRGYRGIIRKKYTGLIARLINSSYFGEDSAYLKFGDKYLLISTDGIWEEVLKKDLYWSGFVSILVNVLDIYAMGGKPLMAVNVISAVNSDALKEMARGIKKASEVYDVIIGGGHVHPDSSYNAIDVAIVGEVNEDSIILSSTAKEHDSIILAVDIDGKPHKELPFNFDSTNKAPEILRKQLESMIVIGKNKLVNAGKDVSNAGIIGTIAMMMEVSGKGCVIDLDNIPTPSCLNIEQWIISYPACGFVVTCGKEKVDDVIKVFKKHRLTAEVIGEVNDKRDVTIKYKGKTARVFDLKNESLFNY